MARRKNNKGAANRSASLPTYRYATRQEAEERRAERGDSRETWTVNAVKLNEKELEQAPEDGASGFYVTWDEDEMIQLMGKLHAVATEKVGNNLYIVYMRVPKERLIAIVNTYGISTENWANVSNFPMIVTHTSEHGEELKISKHQQVTIWRVHGDEDK